MPLDPTVISSLIGLGGTGLSAGGSLLGSGLGLGKQKQLLQRQAELNYEFAEKSARNSPTWNRAGLEQAGYNPMLAVQNATSGANSSWTSTSGASDPDLGSAVGTGLSNAMDVMRVKNETAQTESINDKNYAEADKAKAEKATLIERLPFVSKQAKADYMKTEMESAKLENDIHYQNEYLNYLQNQQKLERELGMMGIDVQRRGQDLNYASSIYNSNSAYKASKYGSDTSRHIADKHQGSGRSESFRNYAFGAGALVGAGGSLFGSLKGAFHRKVGF